MALCAHGSAVPGKAHKKGYMQAGSNFICKPATTYCLPEAIYLDYTYSREVAVSALDCQVPKEHVHLRSL